MSLFSSNIDDKIKQTLRFRQESLDDPDFDGQRRRPWHQQKTSWAMLVSNAALADKTAAQGWDKTSRLKEVLYLGKFNGLLQPATGNLDYNQGFNNGQRHRGDEDYPKDFTKSEVIGPDGVATVSYQNRPTPGITSISVQPKDSKNTIVEATINFQVWTLKDLELYERLYMCPGVTLRLEWGWSMKCIDSDIDPAPTSPSTVWSPVGYYNMALGRRKETGGNWDGMMGKVINFEWQLNNSGGFDCMTKIITLGDMLMSTRLERSINQKSNSSKKDSSAVESTPLTNMKASLASAKETIQEKSVWYDMSSVDQSNLDAVAAMQKVAGVGVPASGEKDSAGEATEYVADDGWFDQGHIQYVYWSWIEDYLITGNLGFNPSGAGSSPFNYDLTDSTYPPGATTKQKDIFPKLYSGRVDFGGEVRQASTCRNAKFLTSCDPFICALPGFELTSLAAANRVVMRVSKIGRLFFDPPTKSSSDQNQAFTQNNSVPPIKLRSFATKDDYERGFIRNILVNVRWVEMVLDKNKTVDGFLKELLDGISEACGGIWEFEVVGDEKFPEMLRVVETSVIEDSAGTSEFVLKVYNKNSQVRNVTMTSKVSERMKGSILAGQARANQENKTQNGTTTDDAKAQSFFGIPVRDLTDYGSEPIKHEDIGAKQADVNKGSKSLDEMKDELRKSVQDLYNDRSDETVDRCKGSLKELVNYSERDGKKSLVTSNYIIPFSLDLEIDGISGLKFGNKLKPDYVPERYISTIDEKGTVTSKIFFQVKQIKHTIDGSGWKTNIETHPVIVPEG